MRKRILGLALLLTITGGLLFWPAQGATTHNVTLTWSCPSCAASLTFNAYRSTVSGGSYVKINTSAITSLSYVDTTGTGGTKYYYVVTSVDSGGVESPFSNEASATFLAPPAAPTGLQAVSN